MEHKKVGERKGDALLGVESAPVERLDLQLRRSKRCDCQRNADVLIENVDQHIVGSPFPRIEADKIRIAND